MNGGWGISYEIVLRWMPLDLTDDKSTLVQVMAWCRQATSHYLNQYWPRSLPPYVVTRPQWVNSLRPSDAISLSTLVQVMASCLEGAKQLSEPVLVCSQLHPKLHISIYIFWFVSFHWRKCIWNVVCKIAVSLSRPQCVNSLTFSDTSRGLFH